MNKDIVKELKKKEFEIKKLEKQLKGKKKELEKFIDDNFSAILLTELYK